MFAELGGVRQVRYAIRGTSDSVSRAVISLNSTYSSFLHARRHLCSGSEQAVSRADTMLLSVKTAVLAVTALANLAAAQVTKQTLRLESFVISLLSSAFLRSPRYRVRGRVGWLPPPSPRLDLHRVAAQLPLLLPPVLHTVHAARHLRLPPLHLHCHRPLLHSQQHGLLPA